MTKYGCMEEHPFRKLIRIAEGDENSPRPDLSPAYEGILQKLTEGPQTAADLGVSARIMLALCNAGYVHFEGVSPSSKDAVWSLKQLTEDEMMSRKDVSSRQPNKDGGDSPFTKKRRRGLSPKAAKALFSKK